MTALRSTISALALSSFAFAGSAHAQEAGAVAERVKAMFLNQGVEMTYAGASGDSATMTIAGVTVKPIGEKEALPIGDLTLNEVEEEDDAISIGVMSAARFSKSQDGIDVVMDGVEITGLVMPSPTATDAITLYDTASIETFTVAAKGKEVFGLTNFAVEVTPPEGEEPLSFAGSAENFTADLNAIEDPEATKVLNALGYTEIDGGLEIEGTWNPKDGRTTLDKYELAITDAGTIGLSLDLSGYTAEFQKALRETQAKIMAAPEGSDNSAAGMAMLGLMQQLTFNAATIRFEDATLTGKVLQYFADQQGARSIDIANQAKAIMPFLLAQLNNPEFAAQVTDAASKFLDAPKSLTITAKPAQPVPFALLAAGAMTAPQTLPQQLGVTVTAND